MTTLHAPTHAIAFRLATALDYEAPGTTTTLGPLTVITTAGRDLIRAVITGYCPGDAPYITEHK
jgi:hypothetical protein